MGKNVQNWCLWCTEGQTDKHIKKTEANPWGNGSESLIVHVFEYECFSVTVLIKPVIIMNCWM